MARRTRFLFISIFCAVSPLLLLAQLPTLGATSLPEPQFDAALSPVILHFWETADFRTTPLPQGKEARRVAVVQRLQETAVVSQQAIQPLLDQLIQAGELSQPDPLWLINGLALRASETAIEQLEAHPNVSHVVPDGFTQLVQSPAEPFAGLEVVVEPHTDTYGLELIRAPHVWHGLGIDGSSVTVGIIDSGVAWDHPDLIGNYRGNQGGSVSHEGHWLDTFAPTQTTPIDYLGHGTHVAGTAIGQSGIGVAPGAQWIAANLSDNFGLFSDSQVHKAFEWVLAPNGNPALAPDIINNSWGGAGNKTAFLEDIAAIHAAGIVTVFAAGNSGPRPQTIGSPASYTDTLAVAATGPNDRVTLFSSRGPSPLTDSQQPQIAAPGLNIFSTYLEGQYALQSGTSMAAPHVAGAIALLLEADPTLTREEIFTLLQETAVPVADEHPNDESGYGRLDVYAAVSRLVPHGTLAGRVRLPDGTPLLNASVVITTSNGVGLSYVTDENGRYHAPLQFGSYQVGVAQFGFHPYVSEELALTLNQTTSHDVTLQRLPSSVISGQVIDAHNGRPLSATVQVQNTPLTVQTNENGRYAIRLPHGSYRLQARAVGYRLESELILSQAGQNGEQTLALQTSPSLLFVDSGQWYFRSAAEQYRTLFNSLRYSVDEHIIYNPLTDLPSPEQMATYDVVIWSDPFGSPGAVGASGVISDFLGLGGNLLMSGQNVGGIDGSAIGLQRWWLNQLQGVYAGIAPYSSTIQGEASGPFADMSLTLNGGSSQNNQLRPDIVRPMARSLTEQLFRYDFGDGAAIESRRCQPFHIIHLGFGLEGVTDAGDRAAILQRSIDHFMTPQANGGVRIAHQEISDFALSGNELVYTLTVQNLSEVLTDTISLALANSSWPTELVSPTLTLGPCESGETVMRLSVPPNLPRDTENGIKLTAVSQSAPYAPDSLEISHKTPGSVLLVDDDRWYDQETVFQDALDELGIPHDTWQVGWEQGKLQRGSPSAELLNEYDFVFWYTAYDWFQPVTPQENADLQQYLEQGGRLFLNSQDFLYYNHQTALAQDYLGVLSYQESITPTQLFGSEQADATLFGPLALEYGDYLNFSDGIVPRSSSQIVVWHDQGMAAGIRHAANEWRTVFWAVPFELLPPEAQTPAMNDIVAWLSDLGGSTLASNRRTVMANEQLQSTLTLHNSASKPTAAEAAISLPAALIVHVGSLPDALRYDAAQHMLLWDGSLQPHETRALPYDLIVSSSVTSGMRLEQTAVLSYPRHNLSFEVQANSWVETADLTTSQISTTILRGGGVQTSTITLTLHNSGMASSETISTQLRLPDSLHVLTDTMALSGGNGLIEGQHLHWATSLAPNEQASVTVVLTGTIGVKPEWLPITAVIQDGQTAPVIRTNLLTLHPYQIHFPYFFNGAE